MSKDSPPSINDYWVTVYLRRYHSHNPAESGERIEVLVRIPKEKAESLVGPGQNPTITISKIWQRAATVASETVGVSQPPFAVTVVSQVDSNMPADLPDAATYRDEDGAEGWILSGNQPKD